VRDAGGHRQDRQPVDEIAELETGGGRDSRPIYHLASEHRLQLPHDGAPAIEIDANRDVARGAMLHRLGADHPLASQREGCAECGMPRERQLHLGREDPDVVAGRSDGSDVGGLGEPDLHRERQHRFVVEALGDLGHNAELVPAERGLGEHVHQLEGHAHGLQPNGGLC